MTIHRTKISIFVAWYDFWVGAYYSQENRTLYLLAIPFVGVKFKFGTKPAEAGKKTHISAKNNDI